MTEYWQQPPPGYPPGYGPPPGYPPQPYGPAPGYPPAAYGPPGYPYAPAGPADHPAYAPAGAPGLRPSSNIGWAIAALLLFWPLCIPSFVFAAKVDGLWNIGDRAGAENASRSARSWGLAGVIVGVVLWILAVLLVFVLLAFVSDTAKHVHDVITSIPTVNPTQT